MTHGQIHAALAARKLSPEQAAEMVTAARSVKTKRPFNPFILVCMFVLACVASVLGLKTNQQA